MFLFSGVVHDLVISVPAGGGYGKPTLYFLIQWAAMGIQHTALGDRLGLRRGWRGWIVTMLVLVLPLNLLFHPEFALGVILPFVRALTQIFQP